MSIEKDELLLLHSSGVLCVKASNAALKNNRQMRVKSFTHPEIFATCKLYSHVLPYSHSTQTLKGWETCAS